MPDENADFLKLIEIACESAEAGAAYARATTADQFDMTAARRFISGIAVSSTSCNANGFRLSPKKLDPMPRVGVPLLVHHQWSCPIGRVLRVRPVGDRLEFVAEVANGRGLSWVEQTWRQLRTRCYSQVSVGVTGTGTPVGETLVPWRLLEISVTFQNVECTAPPPTPLLERDFAPPSEALSAIAEHALRKWGRSMPAADPGAIILKCWTASPSRTELHWEISPGLA